MPASEFEIVQGAYAAWKLTLRDQNEEVITTWTNAAILSAYCWPGDNQAELFTFNASWIDASQGTIRLSVSASTYIGLTVGSYPINLEITGNEGTVIRPVGNLVVLPAAGTDARRAVYTTFDEMKRFAGSWLDHLQRSDADQVGFREERADAREEFDQQLQAHYNGTTQSYAMSASWMGGWRSGRLNSYLTTELEANHLLVTKRIREWCSYWALALICSRQIDLKGEGGYGNAAGYFRGMAENLLPSIVAEIDTNGDGLGDLIIDMSTVPRIRG